MSLQLAENALAAAHSHASSHACKLGMQQALEAGHPFNNTQLERFVCLA
jgi:hypothetical protein